MFVWIHTYLNGAALGGYFLTSLQPTIWLRVYGQRVADMVPTVLCPKTDISGIVAGLMGRLEKVEVTLHYATDILALNFDQLFPNLTFCKAKTLYNPG